MVVLNLTSSLDGGSGKCTLQFHMSLLRNGIESYTAVYGKYYISPDGKQVFIRRHHANRIQKARRRLFRWIIRKTPVNNSYSCYNLSERFTCFSAKDLLASLPKQPEIVVIHWVSNFVNAKLASQIQSATGAKVYYLMLDDAVLTGGCHYPFNCTQYQHKCNNCPISDSLIIKRAVRLNLHHKIKYLPESTCIACSSFDYERAKHSRLFNGATIVKHLLYVDETIFKPKTDQDIINDWGIPSNKKVILFGASSLDEPRKGMSTLLNAIKLLTRDDVVYLIIGKHPHVPLPDSAICTGYLDTESLIKAYQIATVFVCPSFEDSGPIMINQAIMTGTPVVSFYIGVAQDLVVPGKTGYIARSFDSVDLAYGLNLILNLDTDNYYKMSKNCRELGLSSFSTAQEDYWIQHFFLNY